MNRYHGVSPTSKESETRGRYELAEYINPGTDIERTRANAVESPTTRHKRAILRCKITCVPL